MSEASNPAAPDLNPAATEHVPFFITPPGHTDVLLVGMGIFLLLMILLIGVFYFKLHALPEHMAHGANKTQLQVVAVMALLSLLTHNHLLWIGALLLAVIDLPDFASPMRSMARSLRRISGRTDREEELERAPEPAPEKPPEPAPEKAHEPAMREEHPAPSGPRLVNGAPDAAPAKPGSVHSESAAE